MSSGGIQDFEAGTRPTAEAFQALVVAIRELMVEQGAFTQVRRPARYMRTFTPAGRAIALVAADGTANAQAPEMLWQVGPHVQVLPTASLDGVQAAVEEAASSKEVELYEKVQWEEVAATSSDAAPDAFTLIPGEVTCAAQVTPEEPTEGEYDENGNYIYPPAHFMLGAVMTAASTRGQKQRAHTMWPMPQHPTCIGKSGHTCGPWGEPWLLPAPDCEQVLTSSYVPDYTGVTFFVPRPIVYYCELVGRLDRYGRLQLGTSLYYAGRRPVSTTT